MESAKLRIVHMGPMRVAYYSYVGFDPEEEAWGTLLAWADQQGLLARATGRTRFFGFSNPPPTAESSIYGYEAWMTVIGAARADEWVQITQVQGGAYAAMRATPDELLRGAWQRFESLLEPWLAEKRHEIDGTRPWLREHLPAVEDLTQLPSLEGAARWAGLDLLMPIRPFLFRH